MLAIEHSKMILDASHSLAAGVREFLVTEALERRKKKKLLKCSKGSQFSSLGRESLYSAMLVLQHMHTHTRNHFLPTLCRKPNHLFLADICQYPSPALTLLLLHHTCSSPSRGSHPRTLQASAVTTSDELFPWHSREETTLCTAVVLDEYIFTFHFL